MRLDDPIGRIGRDSVLVIAGEAASIVARSRSAQLAVCLDPHGTVTVERVADAIDDDVVGVYTPDRGRIALWRMIEDDLNAALADGRVRVRPVRRVYAGRVKKEAA